MYTVTENKKGIYMAFKISEVLDNGKRKTIYIDRKEYIFVWRNATAVGIINENGEEVTYYPKFNEFKSGW